MDSLVISDNLCRELIDLSKYDFNSDVSVNILGHIFEQSISDLDNLRNLVRTADNVSSRQKGGIYYTPPLVTQLMVDRSIGEWLRERRKSLGFEELPALVESDLRSIVRTKNKIKRNAKVAKHYNAWEEYKDILANIKILDPACGSGAFLNAVFDYLYYEGMAVNRELTRLSAGQSSLLRWDTHILANNIFGVDLNNESIEITKLSLWLKTANKNEKLTYLDDNIINGNSLIDDTSIAGEHAIDWKAKFPKIQGKFDVILGNPPYIDSELMMASNVRERKYISKVYNTARGNWDIYIAFIEKGMSLLKDETSILSFITPDKWLSKDFGDALRTLYAKHITEVISLPRRIFEDVNVDPIICTFKGSPVDTTKFLAHDGISIEDINSVNVTRSIPSPFKLDQLLSPHYKIIKTIEENGDSFFF
ncbi:MAG: N-6 DNA methylase [Planctomycetaceae bacterium]|nr:N-6 DNA methylase [Planctomycetaceae bacterium]